LEKKVVPGVMLTLLLVGMLTLTFNIRTVKSDWGGTVTIRADGSVYPPTAPIATIDNVTYTLTDNINGSVIVERSNIIIDGNKYVVQGFRLWEANVNNVTIQNTNIKGSDFGILLDSSSNNMILENNITAASEYGIYCQRSSGNFIYGNTITNSAAGIRLQRSSNNTLRNNIMANNTYNFGVFGSDLSHFMNDIDVSNTVDGKPIYYWINQHDMVVPSDVGYVGLVNCTGITAQNLNITNNKQGVLLAFTTNSAITKSNLTNNLEGIMLSHSSNNSILENTFFGCGLSILDSYDNSVEDNLVNGKPLVYLEGVSDHVVENAGQVVLVNCDSITVENLNLSHTSYGVWLLRTNNTNIVNNNLTANNGDGISIFCSSNNNISNNNILGNIEGIYLCKSTGNTIANNVIAANIWQGIMIDYSSSNNNISNNNITANEFTGIMLYDSSSNSITNNRITESNWAGIYLKDSSKDGISENDIINNWVGIVLRYSLTVNVTNNSIAASKGPGIWVDDSSLNLIANNNITNNQYGVQLSDSINNTVTGNNVANNKNGVEVYSSNNKFYHNNFVNNTNQVTSTSSNINLWDNGYPSGGNYWSDYAGLDVNSGPNHDQSGSDGIGDAPYVIDTDNQDRYPIVAPINIFEAGVWNGTAYNVDIISNSIVSGFHFNPSEGAFLRFNVTGEDGTAGFCRVTIPEDLLWVQDGQWSVLVGSEPVNYTIIPDENCTYLYFTYNHTTKMVIIQGTDVIPEFPSNILLLIFLMLATASLILTKKIRYRKAKT